MRSPEAKQRRIKTSLRLSAEKRLQGGGRTTELPQTEVDTLKLLHELQVHQIELEMQNEELQRSQDELRISAEKFALLYDFAPVGYFSIGRDRSIRSVNLAGATLLGIERALLVKRNISGFIDDSCRHAFAVFLEQVFSSHESHTCELMLVGKQPAQPLYVLIEATSIQSGQECLVAMVDISGRKLGEEALIRARDELELRVVERTAELAVSLDRQRHEMDMRLQAVEDLRKTELMMVQQNRMAAMGEVIINIAHQWRQPLNVMGLLIQQMAMLNDLDSLSKEELDKTASKIMDILRHLSQTITDFEAATLPDREKSRFSINKVIKSTVGIVADHFSKQGITIELGGDGDPQANGFPNQLGQVLLNLLMNAKDAIVDSEPEERWIRVCSWAEDNRTILTVADSGGGIRDEILDRIFDPYFTTKELGKGSGIGLFMSKVIIEKNMGGRLTALNVGSGAEFRIEI